MNSHNQLTESDGIINQDDTLNDASEINNEEPAPPTEPVINKKRKAGKIYDPYLSFRTLKDATDHLQHQMPKSMLILHQFVAPKQISFCQIRRQI